MSGVDDFPGLNALLFDSIPFGSYVQRQFAEGGRFNKVARSEFGVKPVNLS